jgi:hypothetical protein
MKFLLPNIRYHNQDLTFERVFSDDNSPIISVFDKANNLVEEFGSANLREEQILEKIQEINQDLNVQMPKE